MFLIIFLSENKILSKKKKNLIVGTLKERNITDAFSFEYINTLYFKLPVLLIVINNAYPC